MTALSDLCSLCPRMCNVPRGLGFCGMGEEPVIARAAPHYGEEPVISGTRGAGTVFFSGCSLRCRFCQNAPISHGRFGKQVSVRRLREICDELADMGVHNIDLVNPTHWTNAILTALQGFDRVPVIWNTGGYERAETLRRLEGTVSVYLPDLKYIDPALSKEYSGAEDYFAFAGPALKEMLRQTGPVELDENGLIRRGVIVRHLMLPGCTEDSKHVLDWIRTELPGAWISLMAQYTPMGDVSGVGELERRLMRDEYEEVTEYLYSLGLEEGYVQDLDTGDTKYIPEWDLTGV